MADTISNNGHRIAELRTKAGLSQRALAELLGVSQPVVAIHEAEGIKKLETLKRYAEALGTNAWAIDRSLDCETLAEHLRHARRILQRVRDLEILNRAFRDHIDEFLEESKL